MRWIVWLSGLILSACSSVIVADRPEIEKNARWMLLPFMNHTETPQAGLRAEAIAENALRVGASVDMTRYPSTTATETLFENTDRKQFDDAMDKASKGNYKYALAGSVEEWRYKVGVDGEPAVGITIQVIDVASKKVIWTASGGKTGWSRESLTGVAQDLINELLDPVQIALH